MAPASPCRIARHEVFVREPAKYRARNSKSLLYLLYITFPTTYPLRHAFLACVTPLGRHARTPTYAPSTTTWASRDTGDASLASSESLEAFGNGLAATRCLQTVRGGLDQGTITVRNGLLTVFITPADMLHAI